MGVLYPWHSCHVRFDIPADKEADVKELLFPGKDILPPGWKFSYFTRSFGETLAVFTVSDPPKHADVARVRTIINHVVHQGVPTLQVIRGGRDDRGD